MSALFFSYYQFIVQELAPFRIGWRLLVRHRACLLALLNKSTHDRFDGANVVKVFWFAKKSLNRIIIAINDCHTIEIDPAFFGLLLLYTGSSDS